MSQKYEYKIAIYREPLPGSIFLQGSKVKNLKMKIIWIKL